jgi:hypothetical protein
LGTREELGPRKEYFETQELEEDGVVHLGNHEA